MTYNNVISQSSRHCGFITPAKRIEARNHPRYSGRPVTALYIATRFSGGTSGITLCS